MVDPMVFYLLPILIAYTGGKLIYEHRGGVVGATATMGVILGTSSELFVGPEGAKSPMFLGAMVMGPLAAWCMKKLDGLWDGKIKPGFEMLVNNFSAGIFAAIAAMLSMFFLSPIMHFVQSVAGAIVDWLISHNLLLLTSLLIEPAKVLFLNNAINHGLLTPLAVQQSLEQGKSLLYLLEANPGPGFSILLAYMFFGRGSAKATAPGAAVIHFLGGIHEIYFPYVLMKPQLIIAAIAGGMSGIAVESIFKVGLVGPAAPGSIFAVAAMTSRDSYLAMALGVLAATAVSCIISALILKFSKQEQGDLAAAAEKMQDMKGKKSSVAGAFATSDNNSNKKIEKIVFACDAGMGSSAMGAPVLRNKIKDAGLGDKVTVTNSAINNLKDEYDLLVSHQDLADRAAAPTPSAIHVAVDNFIGSPRYDEIVEKLQEQYSDAPATQQTAPAAETAAPASAGTAAATNSHIASTKGSAVRAVDNSNYVLTKKSIVMDGVASSRAEAIDQAGHLLVNTGSVDQSYVAAMHECEASVSTFMGNGLAIPHGTNEAKSAIYDSAMSFTRYNEPVDWNGKPVKFVIGIAGADGEHLELLQKIAKIFSSKASVTQLEEAGYELVFSDVAAPVIDKLNSLESYTVHEVGHDPKDIEIKNSRGINSAGNPEALAEEIATLYVVTTAVGPTILKFVAKNIAEGLEKRAAAGASGKVAVMACENAINATDILAAAVREHYPAVDNVAVFENTAVDRIVPAQDPGEGLDVTVQNYYEWAIETGPFGDSHPDIPGATWVDDLAPYITRKLFTVNTGHAITAYFGRAAGISKISEVLESDDIRAKVEATLAETKDLIVRKFGFEPEVQQAYIEKIISRFENPHLPDTVERVGRGPLRKISRHERFIGPAAELAEMGRPTDALLATVEVLLAFDVAEDEESQQLQAKLASLKAGETTPAALATELNGIESGHPLFGGLEKVFAKFA